MDKVDALGQNAPQSGPKCQGGGAITAYVVRPHPPDGAPTVGAARIGRGAVLERRAATCGLQNPLRAEWFNSEPNGLMAARCGGCAARSGRAALRRRPAASPSPKKRLETPEAAGQNRPPQQHRPCPRNLFEHRQAAQRDALDCPTAGFECLNVRGPTLGSARSGAQ